MYSAYQLSDVFRERGESYLLDDTRLQSLPNGGLQIVNVSHDDEGPYACSVQNSNLSIIAELEVFSKSDTHTQSHTVPVM